MRAVFVAGCPTGRLQVFRPRREREVSPLNMTELSLTMTRDSAMAHTTIQSGVVKP